MFDYISRYLLLLLLYTLQDLDFSYCPQFGGKDLEQIIPASRKLRHLLLKGTNVSEEALVYYLQQVHKYFGECCLETLDLSAISIEKSVLIGDVAAAAISVSYMSPTINTFSGTFSGTFSNY
jgi:hypothetical protein